MSSAERNLGMAFDLAAWRAETQQMVAGFARDIALRPDPQLHHEQFDLMAIG